MRKTPQNLKLTDIHGSPTYQNLFKAIYGKPASQKAAKLFTGNKDTDFEILQRLDDKDLSQFCLVNTYVNNLCRDEKFWRNRVLLKWGGILGTISDIEMSYKPREIPWKDYYLWIAAAIDSDAFFVYLYADSLGRTDITKILEFEYPEYFSDIDEIFELDEELKEQLRSTKFLAPIRHWFEYLADKPTLNFRIPDHISKKNLLYIIGLSILESDSRKLVKSTHLQDKVGARSILGTRPLYLLDSNYIEPLKLIQYFDKLHVFHGYNKNVQNDNDNYLKAIREYFLELGVNNSHSREKLLRKLGGASIPGVIGLFALYVTLSRIADIVRD